MLLHLTESAGLVGHELFDLLQNLLRILRTYYNNSVAVSCKNITRTNNLSTYNNCSTDFTWPVLVGAIGRNSPCIYGEIHRPNGVCVPDTAVHHNAGSTPYFTVTYHQLPQYRAFFAAESINHKNVSWLSHIHGLMEHQIVPRRDSYSKCLP